VFKKYEELIETLHISDQYTGVIDDTAEDDSGGVVVKVPERKIIFTYNGRCCTTSALAISHTSFLLLQLPDQLVMVT